MGDIFLSLSDPTALTATPRPDNTNADVATRAVWTALAAEQAVRIRCLHFTAAAQLCQHNNAVRAFGGTLVRFPSFPQSLLFLLLLLLLLLLLFCCSAVLLLLLLLLLHFALLRCHFAGQYIHPLSGLGAENWQEVVSPRPVPACCCAPLQACQEQSDRAPP